MMRRVLSAAVVGLVCVALLCSCALLPDIPRPGGDDTGKKDDVVMQHIADAVKNHDAAALKKLFSPRAREKATDLDAGVKYFLSLFPSGRMTWQAEAGGLSGAGDNAFPNFTWESFANYEVYADGKKYDLYFANFITDTAHPDYLGLYAVGVAPYSSDPLSASGAPRPLDLWASQFNSGAIGSGTPGVYIPGAPNSIIHDVGLTPAVEMQHIADAAKNQDAAALKKLFSPRAREKAANLDSGLRYFLSVFPSGEITWDAEGAAQCYERGGYKTAGVANCSFYKVTASGNEYALFFADFVVDQPDSESIGIYALGVAPYTVSPGSSAAAPEQFTEWAGLHVPFPDGKISGPVGVYVPRN